MANRPAGVPKTDAHVLVDFPSPHVLVVTMHRPQHLNSMNDAMEADLAKVFNWFEQESSLWVAIITGSGRLFCAGQDLKGWNNTAGSDSSPTAKIQKNPYGFGSLSRRQSKKPIICALNGSAFGGGTELLLNCDIVIAAEGCKVGMPEVRRGVVAFVGGVPNVFMRSPQMVPYLLNGTPIPDNLLRAHVFTEVVPVKDVLPTAIKWAESIVECSPDAVWVTKQQINWFKQGKGIDELVTMTGADPASQAMFSGDNLKEGLKSFVEKRAPLWQNPPDRSSWWSKIKAKL